jgi:predicted ferric reductase
MVWTVPIDAIIAVGRFAGIVATTLILVQVTLASRAPWVERAVGHDKALRLHGAMGAPIFYILVAHAALITVGYGSPVGRDLVAQTGYFLGHSEDVALAIVSLAVLLFVGVTSVAAVRRRWPYETWHAIHLFSYAAIAISLPHQFSAGSTFRFNRWAAAYWIALYSVAFGSMLVWRFLVPLYRAIRHRLVVEDVTHNTDGSVSLTMVGRHLDGWLARPGQFFLWRFYTKDLWLSAHPYSLSAAPDGRSFRITVKPLGDGSGALSHIRPGTHASASGPYGRFVHHSRIRRDMVLVAAGVGIAPVRAILEDYHAGDGSCHVVVRTRSVDDVPLIGEVHALAQERHAEVHMVVGSRGGGWSTHDGPPTLAAIVPDLSDCDVFVCGPEKWADAVTADARMCGVPQEAIHKEEYTW